MSNIYLKSSIAAASLALCACFHAQTSHPQGYCHQLRTAINQPSTNRQKRQFNNAANRSVLIKQYHDMGCDSV